MVEDFKQKIYSNYRVDENKVAEFLLKNISFDSEQQYHIDRIAKELVINLRNERFSKGGIDAFMAQYDLSSEEGVALMCLAEALLRVPDNYTIDKLIKDKIGNATWHEHLGKSSSLFVNAATWGLVLTGKLVKNDSDNSLANTLKNVVARCGEPVIRQSIEQAMLLLGKQFVMGKNIKDALARSKANASRGYLYSYDMLGEESYTAKDSEDYMQAYLHAIKEVGKIAGDKGPYLSEGVSVKLSALHPRYEYIKSERILTELLPRLKHLCIEAKKYNINLTVDAEESERLDLSLELIRSILADDDFNGWDGFGLALQAYQKRAPYVIDYLVELCKKYNKKICLRLVKGAYWDSEIKHAQELGLSDYPVFTRKATTDVNYLYCAKKLLNVREYIYCQFASHNAHTIAAIIAMCNEQKGFEFQCLHGMGDSLYDFVLKHEEINVPCRIYAPVGGHDLLLSYLVRRLLENGANTSFINQIVDISLTVEDLIACPIEKLKSFSSLRHDKIPLPVEILDRKNSKGIDISDNLVIKPLMNSICSYKEHLPIKVYPSISSIDGITLDSSLSINPAINSEVICNYEVSNEESVNLSIDKAGKGLYAWSALDLSKRAICLEKLAELLDVNRLELLSLLVYEAGKTINDAVAELREAIDFCYYYAKEANNKLKTIDLPGPTGETNQLTYNARGVIVCISPWNFPLAIFLGQITAALVTGNTVVAKPAEQTIAIAKKVLDLILDAGIPKDAVLLVFGGVDVGKSLIANPKIAGVMFTGSTFAAKSINRTLAMKDGPIVPLVAETGGQNAMLVDSSALPEQVVRDAILSAFGSAGQRCSALRVMFVQEDIIDRITELLTGAMNELLTGNPVSLDVDIGPVIDKTAKDRLTTHLTDFKDKILHQVDLKKDTNLGTFVPATLIKLNSIKELKEEVFGPILHLVTFKANELDKAIEDINSTGYGLTLGVQTRIKETAETILSKVKVGNAYLNRNMTGAVVGVQPFGGEGLSGTGPKAGGPNYLLRLVFEKTISIDTTAAGGNASLMTVGD